ncbi:integrin alpha-X-like isoform X3 [Morone saxatilis]|uniref:integrin alpha-X-like isoform X3 n=1 Tax=Morone saxatilis TaxID=34816 RepID=UPI0015E1E61C|nr:integrin alpha-X-like isoform X3 [Morone saxatilis]
MNWLITTTVFLSVLKAGLCFNIDPVAWQSLTNNAAGFGYQVVQRQSDLLVSAPLAPYSQNGRGQIYKCTTTSCDQLAISLPGFAVNMSLGLTMTIDPTTQNTMACGPTIPKDCKSITMYSGLCFQIDRLNRVGPPVPSSLDECRSEADIAFLLDGSGSVSREDFGKMKDFVKNLVNSFQGKDTKFAITQFSSQPHVHYYFNTFDIHNWRNQIDRISQLMGATFTARAIKHVVNNVFNPNAGSRSNVKKVLIVITDGESNDRNELNNAANSAQGKNIVRFAIGVGGAFSNSEAKRELQTIASNPPASHVFQVENFDALEQIRQNLQDKIFSIEGSQTGGESLKMEMSQQGFSAAYVPGGFLMAIVGANQWKGGYLQYTSDGSKTSSFEPVNMEPDSYLDSPSILRGDASDKGRFGSSLAVLPDLNTDGFNDLAVGAPLENDGQGSIYIFHGEGGRRMSLAYSQRIAGSEVKSGLKFFGMSISKASFDHSRDGLPDLAVGSKGTVVLLRSKPIVMVKALVSFNPNQIPTQITDCTTPLQNNAQICFEMTRHSTVIEAKAKINYTLTLDATRKAPNNRAYISEKQRVMTGSIDLDLQQQQCVSVKFFVEACPEDALNSLYNELRFTFDGLPSTNNLRPSLALQAQTTSIHPLGFEINCGEDSKCVDNLKLDFNFTKSLEVKVGIDELLNVTVSVENTEENSYNSHVILTYPAGISFRKFASLKGRIECNSLDSEDGSSRGKTDCTVDKPIFKSNSKASFIVSYGIETNSQLDERIFVTANATSGNQEHSVSSQLYKMKWIDVKYSIFVTTESSLSYTNFTYGKNDLQKPVQQSIVVTNDIRALNLTVVIKVPVKLGDKDIWVDSSSLQFPDCQVGKDEEPRVMDFVAEIQKKKLVDCSVARCRVFKCTRFMGRLEQKTYKISANLSSGWIEQIGLKSAKFILTSTASLEYDRKRFIFYSTGSSNEPPVRKIEAEVEVYPEHDFTKEIVGGSLGGLALLALLTAGLYKAGFFKSKYKEMINEAGKGADGVESTPDAQA